LLLLVSVTLSEKYGGIYLTKSSCIIFPGAYFVIPASTENFNHFKTASDIALATSFSCLDCKSASNEK